MLVCGATARRQLPILGGVSCLSMLLRMLDCGLQPSQEPFLSACLRAVRRAAIAQLRHKARILVPERAVTLVGSPDETGTLRENEVFLQVQPPVRAWGLCNHRAPGAVQSETCVCKGV